MRQCIWVVGLAVLAAGCGASVNVEQERNNLLALDREWSQTTKDAKTFLSYFASDATAYAPGMPAVSGTEAIGRTWAGMISAPGFALSWTPTKADVSSSGDLGSTAGTYEMSMGGATDKGKYVSVWKKQPDGAWKVSDDIFNSDMAPGAGGPHVMAVPSALTWAPGPPSLPPGSKLAVVSGDPTKAEPFVMRAEVPAGYRIAAHWHPTTENLTILSGTIAIGMGEQFAESALQNLPAGSYASLPAEMRHYFLARTAATFQVHGVGPFVVNYVNPADDPSKQSR